MLGEGPAGREGPTDSRLAGRQAEAGWQAGRQVVVPGQPLVRVGGAVQAVASASGGAVEGVASASGSAVQASASASGSAEAQPLSDHLESTTDPHRPNRPQRPSAAL
ncbi:hypothetical protein GCM10009741_07120 [Kribbella lupini]|uniref:Uncharacterized protein n=1 Tax=Kribbella lupini TaxID=291602 RepID=A0ABN2A602_9ACTN